MAADSTQAGEVSFPHPTLHNLSVEWAISGDDDLDGEVTVRYRPLGGEFRQGPPLRRVPAGSNGAFSWKNRHAGSLFGLAPATTYEVELTLTDPDGGGDKRTLQVSTRAVPAPAASAPVVAVSPATVAQALKDAKPGTILELGPGTYPTLVMTTSGTAQAPIVLRGSSAKDVLIDGDVRLDGLAHVFVESVTIQGRVKLNGGVGIVVRGCTINTPQDGIVAFGAGSTDGYFADNTIVGVTPWNEGALGVDGNNIGEGIQLTGAGNVIAHNLVRGFRDCISLLEDGEAVEQRSIDIHNNDLSICADDAIEADFAMGNVRVYQNRIRSSFVGLSSQPSLGGPTYFLRNAMYGVIYTGFKLHRGSVGDVILHNTIVKNGDALGIYAGKTWSRALFRNNLFLGGTGGGSFNGFDIGNGQVAVLADADDTCDLDYDGFGSVGTGFFSGRIGPVKFNNLAELQGLTTEKHAVQLGLDALNAQVSFPSSPFPEPTAPDLRLASNSAAIDRGLPLPGINDDFQGAAPDLGAHEGSAPLPVYGPRDENSGGAAGSGGSGGPGGAGQGGSGGTPGQGGAAGSGGGTSGQGGSGGDAGSAQAGSGGNGASGPGGSSGTSGQGGVSGTSGQGGAGVGPGGAAGASGSTTNGGTSGQGEGGAQAGGSEGAPAGSSEESGCGCMTAGSATESVGAWGLLGLLVASRLRRRR